MKRAEDLQTVEAALHQAGFQVSQRCISRACCFDFATRRDENLIFIKVLPNIDGISRTSVQGIKAVSRCFSAASLFISKMKGGEMLRDDTVYSRYGVNVVTPKTFEDTILRNSHPLVKAAPGGYFVKMNGRKIRERRHELGLSIGKLAAMTDISRSTLYGYERGMTSAAVQVAYKLEKVLGVPLVKTIDLFETSQEVSVSGSANFDNCDNVKSGVVRSALKKLSHLNLNVSFISRAPFDFAARCPDTGVKIIGGVFQRRERTLRERLMEILSLGEIIRAKTLLLSQERIKAPSNITFLTLEELSKMKDKEDFASLLL